MESGRQKNNMGWVGGGTFMESGRGNFIMGHDPLGWRGGANIHGIRKEKFYHGTGPFRVGGTFMESDPLGSGTGGTFMESGRNCFNMGYDPLGWGGNIHGIRKKTFYRGIYDPLGWGGNIHGIRKKEFLSWDTRRGWLWGSPTI